MELKDTDRGNSLTLQITTQSINKVRLRKILAAFKLPKLVFKQVNVPIKIGKTAMSFFKITFTYLPRDIEVELES